MTLYRNQLTRTLDRAFLTDGGLETTLIFHDGIDLPLFAAFALLKDAQGTAILRDYFARYARLAMANRMGFVLEAPTWRANQEWGARLGYDAPALRAFNRSAIDLMVEIRETYATAQSPMIISGNIGPRGDGYRPTDCMSVDEAARYHGAQIDTFADTPADMVAAFTLNYVDEAVGISRAAERRGMPVAISFTVETDGRLPGGTSLAQAIARTDAETDGYPAHYMINCAHPTHFDHVLEDDTWCRRIRGLRANASRRSHAELDESTDLDDGNPMELGAQYAALRSKLPNLAVVGGCCGTDHRHVEAIAVACAA